MKNSLRFYSVFFIVILAFALDGCNGKKQRIASEEPTMVTKHSVPVRNPPDFVSGDSVIVFKEKIFLRNIQYKHTVLLQVDTENITHGSPAKIKSYCSFPDLDPSVPIADYTTDVQASDSIVWIGESMSEPNVVVCIERVNFRSNNRIYGGPFDGENCKVEGKIKDTAEIGDEETYTISFTVEKGSPPYPRYTLDPKIRIH